jgi:hypothetical protein
MAASLGSSWPYELKISKSIARATSGAAFLSFLFSSRAGQGAVPVRASARPADRVAPRAKSTAYGHRCLFLVVAAVAVGHEAGLSTRVSRVRGFG